MKLCLFSHYFDKNYIPNYVLYYLERLTQVVDKVILLTNRREIQNKKILDKLNIEISLYDNEGYDFGMYYKYLTQNQIDCDKLFLVNDSMIIFDRLNSIMEWVDRQEDNILSITSSNEEDFHLQSYFWVMDREVQIEFISYLYRQKIIKNFRDVISIYEIGFSQHLLKNGYKLKSKYINGGIDKYRQNNTIHNIMGIINDGNPMIKKKVVLKKFRNEELLFLESIGYNFKKDYWQIIEENKEDNLNINYLKKI